MIVLELFHTQTENYNSYIDILYHNNTLYSISIIFQLDDVLSTYVGK